jgi:hypothetical protein
MNWTKATLTELYTIAAHDEAATTVDKWQATEEIIRRQKKKPQRRNQMKIRSVAARW